MIERHDVKRPALVNYKTCESAVLVSVSSSGEVCDVQLRFTPLEMAGMTSPKVNMNSLKMPKEVSVAHMKVANKETARKDLQRMQRIHIEKITNMKPGIDMKPPATMNLLKYNAKRIQVEAERNATIERENKILLGKMYTIMNAEPAYKTQSLPSNTSLNMSIRKAEYDRIARENQAIMQRILKRESNFNRATLEAVRREGNKTFRAPQYLFPHH